MGTEELTLKELYVKFYNHIKDKTYIVGLCHEIKYLDLSWDNEKKLTSHFHSQRPSKSQHTEFYNSHSFNNRGIVPQVWWWDFSEDDNPINRIAFVKYLSEIDWKED